MKTSIHRLEYIHKWRKEHPDSVKKIMKKHNKKFNVKMKLDVLSHYGVLGIPKCVICGEDDMRCLSIDHINGGGLSDRKSKGVNGGTGFYHYLKKHGYPLGFQTLCMNCQFKKRYLDA
jgi:hypothetical protein